MTAEDCCGRAEYHCDYCGEHRPVPVLARDCEDKHEAEARDVA